MSHFTGLEAALTTAIARGYIVHSLHQEGSGWHCRLKLWHTPHARYSYGDSTYPAEAVSIAMQNAEVVLSWKPTLGTLTRLKALKPDLEALLKEI